MILTVDTTSNVLILEANGKSQTIDLYSKESFELISHFWLKVGWQQKYTYTFTWMGRPIVQLPDDIMRVQEVIYKVKPDVIIETGIAHGGSLIFYASLCKAMERGRVIGIDIEIRPHNRRSIEDHELFPYISLIEGSSTDGTIVERVKSLVKQGETVIVLLDSNHTKQHVLDELEAYHDLVTPGSYIVATDGIMKDLHDVPRGDLEWAWNNPASAVIEFVQKHPEFEIEQPKWDFNESMLSKNVTHWPNAWLKRK